MGNDNMARLEYERAEARRKELAVTKTKALAPVEQQSMTKLLELAVEKELDVAALEKLVELSERVADRAARQEFADALADFQSKCPPIAKTSTAHVTSRKQGTRWSYRYAELDTIAKVVNPLLSQLGLSYSWDSTVDGEMISCRCTLRHINGHSESASFAAPVGALSQAMSKQQEHAAALTFARRQSLIQVLGLTTTEPDADGATGGETISESQVANLEALIDEVNANYEKFLKFAGVDKLENVQASAFPSLVAALEKKR